MENYEKKYKEALERARLKRDEYKRLDGDKSFVPQDIESIFPELKESEDERIRRKFIKALKECGFTHFNEEFTVQEALTWLEKQGEQKPTEWSEHQHKLLNYAISMTDDTEVKCFLESLRNTGSNTSADWSEEDEMMLECVLDKIGDLGTGEMIKDWLKSLKERIKGEINYDR